MPRYKYAYLVVILILIALDQGSKYLLLDHYAMGARVDLYPGFAIHMVVNPGMAFSLFSDNAWMQSGVLLYLSLALLGIVCVWFYKAQHQDAWILWSLTLIIAGAVGNICDRFLYGHVIDFIDLYYQHYHWPVFNLADSFISVGSILMFLDIFRKGRGRHGTVSG
jgi:signal peptidase II